MTIIIDNTTITKTLCVEFTMGDDNKQYEANIPLPYFSGTINNKAYLTDDEGRYERIYPPATIYDDIMTSWEVEDRLEDEGIEYDISRIKPKTEE